MSQYWSLGFLGRLAKQSFIGSEFSISYYSIYNIDSLQTLSINVCLTTALCCVCT